MVLALHGKGQWLAATGTWVFAYIIVGGYTSFPPVKRKELQKSTIFDKFWDLCLAEMHFPP